MAEADNKPGWFEVQGGNKTTYTDDSAKRVRRLQEQCYLIDNWRLFVSYSMKGRTSKADNFRNFTPIHGGSPESLVSLLTGKSNTQILFDMTPAQKALLVPKIRIFKSYLDSEPGDKNKFKDVEIQFPSEAFNREDIRQITETKFGRGHGVGIKAFEWIYDGKDPAQVKYSTKCKLTMFFQNLEDFTKERPSLTDPEITYKFSDIINPFEAKAHQRYKERSGSRHEGSLKKNVDHEAMWRLKATVGWSKPTTKDRRLMSKELLRVIDECVVVLYLTVTTHEISFNQDGSLNVTVNFVGALENALTDPSADVFLDPNTIAHHFLGKPDPTARALEAIKQEKARRQRETAADEPGSTPNAVDASDQVTAAGRYSALSDKQLKAKEQHQKNSIALETAKRNVRKHARLIRDLMQSGRIKSAYVLPEELGIFGNKQLTRESMARFRKLRVLGKLTDTELMAAGVDNPDTRRQLLSQDYTYTTTAATDPMTNKSARGKQYGKSGNQAKAVNTVQGKQAINAAGSNSETLKSTYEFYHGSAQKQSRYTSDNDDYSVTNYDTSIKYTDRKASGILEGIKADYAKKIKNLDSAASLEYLRETMGMESPPLRIEFMYFGDIIDAAMNILRRHPDRGDMRILMGDLYFTDPFSSNKAQVNLADIPISLNMFLIWFHNRIVKRDMASMSVHDFIKDIVSYIISPVFGTACVSPLEGGPPSKNILNIKTFSFNAPAGANGKDRLRAGNKQGRLFFSNQGAGGLVKGSHAQAGKKRITLQTPSGVTPTRIFNYSLMHATIHDMNRLSGDEALDSANGIYHLRVGADKGLAKKFNFKAETRKFAAEAAVVDRSQRTDIEGLRGSKYNCDIEMIGNPLFQNGQYVFIDPSMMGFGNFSGDAFKKNQRILRLGGYYLIIEVECSVDAAGFQTVLKCLWESFPTGYKGSRRMNYSDSVEIFSGRSESEEGVGAIDPNHEIKETTKAREKRSQQISARRQQDVASGAAQRLQYGATKAYTE